MENKSQGTSKCVLYFFVLAQLLKRKSVVAPPLAAVFPLPLYALSQDGVIFIFGGFLTNAIAFSTSVEQEGRGGAGGHVS